MLWCNYLSFAKWEALHYILGGAQLWLWFYSFPETCGLLCSIEILRGAHVGAQQDVSDDFVVQSIQFLSCFKPAACELFAQSAQRGLQRPVDFL